MILRHNINRPFATRSLLRTVTLGVVLVIVPGAARAEDKTYVSEIAKNKPGLTVIYSGAATQPAARAFANAVMEAKPKQKTAANVQLVPADKFTSSVTGDTTFVFMLVGKEIDGDFAPAVKSALPPEIRSPQTTLSLLNSRITSDKKNAGAFAITLFAPDSERFSRLLQDFNARRFGEDFRAMGQVSRQFKTNKVAIFSNPELRPQLDGWGTIDGDRAPQPRGAVKTQEVWNAVKFYDLAKRSAVKTEDLADTAEVYMVDRSQTPKAVLPPDAVAALAGNTVKTLTVVSARTLADDGRTVAVFSAPDARLLKGRLNQFPNLDALPDGVLAVDAVDLRRVGPTVLLVNGDASNDEREALRSLLAREMRRDLGITIDEGDRDFANQFSSDQAMRDLAKDADLLRLASQETRSPYLWTFTLTEYSGRTQYFPSEKSLTTAPPPFNEPEPQAPIKTRNISDEAYAILTDEYRDDRDDWERRKRNYEQHTAMSDFQWRREVRCDETAETRGIFRLISLAEKGKVLWEKEVEGSSSNSFIYQNDTIAVQGPEGRPSSLESPPALNSCSDKVMRKAALFAGQSGFTALAAEAWLADPNKPLPPEPTEVKVAAAPQDNRPQYPPAKNPADTPVATAPVPATVKPALPAKPVPAGPKVAAIHGKTVYLNIGAKQGVKVGDRFRVALAVLEIKDPDTGAVLERKPIDSLVVRVTGGTATAECVADTPADAAKLGKVKIGQGITKLAPKAPVKAVKKTGSAR